MKMTKRIMAVLLTMVMLLSVFPAGASAAGAGVTFQMGTASAKAGETVTVPINITQNSGIAYARMDITYDASKLELTAVNVQSGIFDTVIETPNDPYTITLDSCTAKAAVTYTGKVAEFTFKLKEDAQPGDVAVSLAVDQTIDWNGKAVAPTAISGKVTVADHTWGTPSYSWSADNSKCTASVSCTCCTGNTKSETVTAQKDNTPATCTDAEKTVYTAEFTNALFAKQTKEVTGQAKLGHDWNTPTYTWSADFSKCTASHSCKRSGCVVTETEDGKITETTNASSCYAAGTKVYTAKFTKQGFTTQEKSETLAVVGHAWGAPTYTWNADKTSCTAKRVCTASGCTANETETATATVEKTDASCTKNGSVVSTATFQNEAFAKQVDTKVLTKSGHNWSSVTYTWAADNSKCTAERTCQNENCPVQKETETKNSDCVTVEATEDKDGSKTWTVKFENSAFETQTKKEILKAEPMIKVSSATVCPGKTVNVTVEIKNNPGAAMLELDLAYDSAVLELAEVKDAALLEGFVGGEKLTNNPYYLSWLDNDAEEVNGKLVTLTFKVKETAAADAKANVSVSVISALDTNFKNIAFKTSAGSVTVQAHDMSDATCTAPATCSKCGITEGEKLGHDMADATCTKPATCKRDGCNYTEGKALGHKEETVPGKAATCTEPGLTDGKKCTVCKEVTVKQSEIKALGHTWDEGTVTKEPTCTEKGEKIATCTVCGTKDDAVEIPALDHTWDEGKVTTEASCTKEGVKTYTCIVEGCSATKTEAIDALGHAVEEKTWKSDDTNHWHECTACGEKLDTAKHSGGKATTTKKAKCEICGAEYGALKATTPQTGDDSNIALFGGLMAVSVLAIAALLLFAYRKRSLTGKYYK